MKVLHLVAGEQSGGAAKGAYNLHAALNKCGVDSSILTNARTAHSDHKVTLISKYEPRGWRNTLRAGFESAIPALLTRKRGITFSTGLVGFDFTAIDEYQAADVIHLHWINNGLVSIRDLSKIAKPAIWTLRDMWPMTGGCHYSMGCTRYIERCGSCPQFYLRAKHDLSTAIWNNKRQHIPASLKIVGISHWLAEQARASSLLGRHDIRTISNNIDTEEFFSIERHTARKFFGIETSKKVIALGATSPTDYYKGFEKFTAAARILDKRKYHVVFFGKISKKAVENFDLEHTNLGYLRDSESLRKAYSAADVFVAPSLMDAFGKTLAEALACGTPVVCFDATGPRDIVDHKVNGYRAQPYDPYDLATGIEWVCTHSAPAEMSEAARRKVTSVFDSKVVAKQYLELYRELLAHAVAKCP